MLELHHPDPTAIIWYAVTETDDPDAAPAPEMLVPGSLIYFGDVELRASLAPVVTIKARAYVTRDDGVIAPGPVTTATYHLTTTP